MFPTLSTTPKEDAKLSENVAPDEIAVALVVTLPSIDAIDIALFVILVDRSDRLKKSPSWNPPLAKYLDRSLMEKFFVAYLGVPPGKLFLVPKKFEPDNRSFSLMLSSNPYVEILAIVILF